MEYNLGIVEVSFPQRRCVPRTKGVVVDDKA